MYNYSKNKSSGECTQSIINNINYFTLYGASCNGKPSCRVLPTRVNSLADCGGKAANLFHVKYVCALGMHISLYNYYILK